MYDIHNESNTLIERRQFKDSDPEKYIFHCPGCDFLHVFNVDGSKGEKNTWQFNGDLENPTFHPSLLLRMKWGEDQVEKVCHLYLREGKIQFLNDCTHDLAGETVNLPKLEQ